MLVTSAVLMFHTILRHKVTDLPGGYKGFLVFLFNISLLYRNPSRIQNGKMDFFMGLIICKESDSQWLNISNFRD